MAKDPTFASSDGSMSPMQFSIVFYSAKPSHGGSFVSFHNDGFRVPFERLSVSVPKRNENTLYENVAPR
ncbi:hypothetical protein EMCG_01549 [[Emmonsia] crescens]|uniref:Uncharacterized protein n=1 Tax=[Emmonsia] crescens TaxID=73230 RepID=A0A0G2J2I9_9EURO|nr:hypothetical protein EMCG_01549 [Emmonsia crescens UAMH 3008]